MWQQCALSQDQQSHQLHLQFFFKWPTWLQTCKTHDWSSLTQNMWTETLCSFRVCKKCCQWWQQCGSPDRVRKHLIPGNQGWSMMHITKIDISVMWPWWWCSVDRISDTHSFFVNSFWLQASPLRCDRNVIKFGHRLDIPVAAGNEQVSGVSKGVSKIDSLSFIHWLGNIPMIRKWSKRTFFQF